MASESVPCSNYGTSYLLTWSAGEAKQRQRRSDQCRAVQRRTRSRDRQETRSRRRTGRRRVCAGCISQHSRTAHTPQLSTTAGPSELLINTTMQDSAVVSICLRIQRAKGSSDCTQSKPRKAGVVEAEVLSRNWRDEYSSKAWVWSGYCTVFLLVGFFFCSREYYRTACYAFFFRRSNIYY